MRRLALATVVLVLLGGCFGSDPNLTEGGKGKPLVTAEFPERVPRGGTATATFTIENPGPGDMGSVVMAFATVGVAGASGPIPGELVPLTTSSDNPVIASIEPEPRSVSDDGVIYVFDGLPEGESRDISFEIRVPEEAGPAANSVSVYAGEDADRIRGVLLQTEVTG